MVQITDISSVAEMADNENQWNHQSDNLCTKILSLDLRFRGSILSFSRLEARNIMYRKPHFRKNQNGSVPALLGMG